VSDLTALQQEALGPLRRVLLATAAEEAAGRRAEAEEAGRRVEEEAATRATRILEEARRRGAADGADRVRSERAAARREAREVVQRARQSAYHGLREAAVDAVAEVLAHDPARARLRALVLAELGDDARLTQAPGGGVVGETPDGRRVDASAERLVDLALDRLDLEGLWTP
jgi:vacuolar-type H+-ATPase subunit H